MMRRDVGQYILGIRYWYVVSDFEFASYSKWTSTSEWDEIQIGNEYDYVKSKKSFVQKKKFCSNFYIYYMERDIHSAVGIAS